MRKYRQPEFHHLHRPMCEAQLASSDELSAYIDKELPPWKRHLIRRHLKKCETCAAQVKQLQHTDHFIRQSGAVEVSDNFLDNVMARAAAVTKTPAPQERLWSRFTRFIGIAANWGQQGVALANKLRYGIRTRSPVYIFVLTFAVFTMVGATLYQSDSGRFRQSAHTLKKSQVFHGEKLISFEVIQHEPPKRLLTTHTQRK